MSVSARDLQNFGNALSEYVKKVQVHGFKHAGSIALFSGSRHFSDLLSEDVDTDNFDAQLAYIKQDPFMQAKNLQELVKKILTDFSENPSAKTAAFTVPVKLMYKLLRSIKKNHENISPLTFERLLDVVFETGNTNLSDAAMIIAQLFEPLVKIDEDAANYAELLLKKLIERKERDVAKEGISKELRDVLDLYATEHPE